MKTYSAKASEIDKKWIIIDAEGLVVGRLASLIALRLQGQAQARLHAPYGLRRQRHRRQRGQGAAHRR
jgi:ribosomal protein L13